MARRVADSDFGRLLKGSDVVEARKKAVAGVILEVRDAPEGFNSPYIIDFDSDLLPDTHSWPCNKTEARRIRDLTKEANPDKWAGWCIGLQVVQVNNPKLARANHVPEWLVDSLAVAFVLNPKEAEKKRKSKVKYKKAGDGLAAPAVDMEDVPF